MLVDPVFNLITKEHYYNKPTYDTLEQSLISMLFLIKSNNVKNIAMPKIGCGLDKLEWKKVRGIIKDVFMDEDVNIVVCYL